MRPSMQTTSASVPDMDFAQYPSPTVTLPAYVKLGLSASVAVLHERTNTVALTARMDNALDRHYEEVLHFPTPGRTLYVGARITATR